MTRRGSTLVLAAFVVAGLALLSHVSSWVGHNGDHYYYASTALQYSGVPYDTSLRETTSYFSYPFPFTRLDLGYQHPDVAPLVYPRVVLPLLAVPWTRLMGPGGVYVPGLVMGTLSCLVLVVLALRRVGRAGALALPALLLGSVLVTEFAFGIYSESPIVLGAALLTTQLPLGVRRGRWHVLTAAALVPLMMLSRQVPLLPIGMVLGGWLWTIPATRRLRNEWLPFVLAVVPVTVVTYGVMSVWAPYSPLPFLRAVTGAKTDGQLLGKIPSLFVHAMSRDLSDALRMDHVGPLLVALALVGLVVAIRSPLAGVFLGSLVSSLSAVALNGQLDDFRYAIPSLPPLALLAAVGVSWAWRRGRRRPWRAPPIARPAPVSAPAPAVAAVDLAMPGTDPDPDSEPEPADVAAPTRGPRWTAAWTAVTAWTAVVLLVVATVWVHRPADTTSARTLQVSQATWRGVWPLTISGGTLTCAGSDDQVWLVAGDGTRYAVSGAAMAHSFFTARIASVRAGPTAFAWNAVLPLLDVGMRLCPGGLGYGR